MPPNVNIENDLKSSNFEGFVMREEKGQPLEHSEMDNNFSIILKSLSSLSLVISELQEKNRHIKKYLDFADRNLVSFVLKERFSEKYENLYNYSFYVEDYFIMFSKNWYLIVGEEYIPIDLNSDMILPLPSGDVVVRFFYDSENDILKMQNVNEPTKFYELMGVS